MKCTNCGKKVPETAKVCGHCGHPLKEEIAEPVKTKPRLPRREKDTSSGLKWVLIGACILIVVLAAVFAFLFLRSNPQFFANLTGKSTPDANVLLYDDFIDPDSGWAVFTDGDNAEVGYEDGAYRIAFLQSDNFQAGWSPLEYDNVVVETVFSVPLGETGLGAGLTLRANDQRWYLIWIFPHTQEFILMKSIDGQSDELIPRQRSEILQPLLKDKRLYLQLKVVATSDSIEVWGAQPGQEYQFLESAMDSTLTSGHLGPSANSTLPLVHAPAEVLFDWIKVSKVESVSTSAVGQPEPQEASEPAATPMGGGSGDISFCSNINNDLNDIYVKSIADSFFGMQISNPINLTNTSAISEYWPLWVDEGRSIAYETFADKRQKFFQIPASGGAAIEISFPTSKDILYPVVSPDGTKVAFILMPEGQGKYDVFVVNLDGTHLVNISDNPAGDFNPKWSPDSTQLSFETDRNGKVEIMLVNADGTQLKPFATDGGFSRYADWSPDGKWIAFTSDMDGYADIYRRRVTGTQTERVTTEPSFDWLPRWSPDGETILFLSDRGGMKDIYLANILGGQVRRLTYSQEEELEPVSWSPDGSEVLYWVKDANKNGEIKTVSSIPPDISEWEYGRYTDSPFDECSVGYSWAPDRTLAFTRVEDDGKTYNIYVRGFGSNASPRLFVANALHPSWSPDGSKLAFSRLEADGTSEIYTIMADGTGLTRLTNNSGFDGNPFWSPDGMKIAFSSDRDGNADIFVMNADGSNPVNIHPRPEDDRTPVWSPSGEKILFTTTISAGNRDIMVMKTNGSELVNITNNTSDDSWGAWSPDGTRIAFYSNRGGNKDIYIMYADGSYLIQFTDLPTQEVGFKWLP